MKKAFTMIELLVVVAVLLIVVVLLISSSSIFNKKSTINSLTNNVFSIIGLAKNKTVASEGANRYGIYFDTSVEPNKYVLFQGINYASRNISFDEIHVLPKNIEFSSLNFSGIGNEIVFDRLTGATDNNGFVIINSMENNISRTIYLYSSGEVSFNQETVSGVGRLIDSRHVHFDLGWDISGSTTLRFDFINVGQVRDVIMADYFSIDDFDWEGEFVINNIVQKFRIHTHALSPSTQLCIHRDRDENKNNQEVYIYIIQGGIIKNIAHYDDNIGATVYKGNYVWNQMQIQ
ncbi:MAG: prepilin-type N-terminal cleavage/methylation domain-containing protein [Patescibacteria group bacterium]